MAQPDNLLDNIAKHIECGICYSPFNNPQTLQCKHTYCKDCLDGLLVFNSDGSAVINCPMRCEGLNRIPANKTTEFLGVMYEFKGIIDLYKQGATVDEPDGFCCNDCDSSASFHCKTCTGFFCKACRNKHRDHSTSRIAYSENCGDWKLVCSEHNTIAELYCCNQFICVYCQHRKHKGHHCESLKEQASRIRELSRDHEGNNKVEKIMTNARLNFEDTASEFRNMKLSLIDTLKSRIADYITEQLKLAEEEATNILNEYDRVAAEHLKLFKDVSPSEYLKSAFEKTDLELILEKEKIVEELRRYNVPIPSLTIGLTEGNNPNMLGSLEVHGGKFVSIGSRSEKDYHSRIFSLIPQSSDGSDIETLVKKVEDLLIEVNGKLSSFIPEPTYSQDVGGIGESSKPIYDEVDVGVEGLNEALATVELKKQEYIDELFKNGKEKLLIEMIKARPALAKSENSKEVSLLHSAAQYGFSQLAKHLLENKLLDVNVRQKFKQTPLHYGAFHNKPQVIQILLDFNCDTELENHKGNRAIDVARQYKSREAFQLLDSVENNIYETMNEQN